MAIFHSSRRSRATRAARTIAFLLTLTGFGAGCVSPATHEALVREHGALRERVEAIETEERAQRVHLERLESRLQASLTQADNVTHRLDDVASRMMALEQVAQRLEALLDEQTTLLEERSKLRAALTELQRKFRDLAQRKQVAEAKAEEYREIVDRFETLVRALD